MTDINDFSKSFISKISINNIIIDFFNNEIPDEELRDQVISKFTSEGVQNKILGVIENTKNKKRTKKEKSKKNNGSKKPLSAYIYFCKENRSKIKEENPDSDVKEITCILAKEWNKIKNDSEKCAKYLKLASEGKEKYNQEKENVVDKNIKNGGELDYSKKNGKSVIKKARTSYILYCSDMRKIVKEENPELKPKEILTKLGEKWREEKNNHTSVYEKYINMAKLDKERYEKEKNDIERV